MYKNIQEIIENEFKYVTIDKRFLTKLEDFLKNFRYKHKDIDNSEFLGGNLLGVHPFKFSDGDKLNFYKNLLFADESKYKRAFHNLEGINLDFKVSSDPLYLTVVTLMHMVYNSHRLSMKDQKQALRDLFMIMSYKCFGSMYNHFFKYEADPAVAKATFEALNNKFILKKEGSWQGVFEYRSHDVQLDGIFGSKIKELNTDNAIEVINGIHGRFKDMLKNLFQVYLTVKARNEKIATETKLGTNVDDGDKEKEFKETSNLQNKYIYYLKSIINSESDLVDESHIHVISNFIPSCKKDKLEMVLEGIANTPYPKDTKEDYIERIIVSSLNYLITKGITSDYSKKIRLCLIYLKGYWSSGTIKEPVAREAKNMANELVGTILGSTNKTVVPGVAMGFNIYLFLLAVRAFK